MTTVAKNICDEILRYGTIIKDNEYECDGDCIRQYTMKYENEEYIMTKCNGEWIYFNHIINKEVK